MMKASDIYKFRAGEIGGGTMHALFFLTCGDPSPAGRAEIAIARLVAAAKIKSYEELEEAFGEEDADQARSYARNCGDWKDIAPAAQLVLDTIG